VTIAISVSILCATAMAVTSRLSHYESGLIDLCSERRTEAGSQDPEIIIPLEYSLFRGRGGGGDEFGELK
jgi:hypothetical protein